MLAHVDHGKSALSDALVASNGHISARSAGHVRYLDSRADEQRRGITMKSSSIALGSRGEDGELLLVNLVDSPGHVDFSGEVDAALRVCDGCLIVVDVVEGVCVQTVAVLKAALERGVVPCLVLNKVDRLFCELRLSVVEAYWRIVRVLEQVNVVMGVREVEDMMARADVGQGEEWEVEGEHGGGSSGYFSPEKGNVVFASATDGWAFRVEEFAAIFSAKFGISEQVLRKTLWGDYVLMAKSKKIVRKSRRAKDSDGRQVMFVQMVLTSLHSVYDAVYSTANDMELAVEKRGKIVTKLGLTLTNRDLRHKDASIALRSIMSAWLPAAPALLGAIMTKLPTAAAAQRDPTRRAVLWPHLAETFSMVSTGEKQRKAVETADADSGAPLLAFVTKMLEPVNAGSASGGRMNIRVPRARPKPNLSAGHEDAGGEQNLEAEADERPEASGLVAFTRLLSGSLAVGDTVYVYGPRYAVKADGCYDEASVAEATVTSLYLLMGRDMEVVSKVMAGCVVGIGGLGDVVLKTATVSSLPPGECLPLGSSGRSSALGASNDAVVRVAVEPHLPKDVPALQAGLRKLNQADPAVDTYVTSTGEHVITASGELHLERCLLDLRERFAPGIKIHVSPPIISFRETISGGVSTPPLLDLQDGFKLHSAVAGAGAKKENATNKSDGKESGLAFVNQTGLTDGAHASRDPASGWGISLEGIENSSSSISDQLATVKHYSSPFLKDGRKVVVGNGFVAYRLCSAPLPVFLATALDEVGTLVRESVSAKGEDAVLVGHALDSARNKLRTALESDAEMSSFASNESLKADFIAFWGKRVMQNAWSCGPRRFGSNLLIGPTRSKCMPEWTRQLFSFGDTTQTNGGTDQTIGETDQTFVVPKESDEYSRATKELENSLTTGFQLAVQAGPMCEEPMHGVAVFVENIVYGADFVRNNADAAEVSLPSSIAGLAIGSTKEALRLCFLNTAPRIMEAALNVSLSVAGDALGRMYTVLAKRRGRVLCEDMKDGVNIFNVEAVLPLTESFGFAEALRKQTSGFASAQMVFSHWEVVDVDPFWSPRTEEELEDIAVEDDTEAKNNLARKLVTSVRKRKGLRLEEKIVQNAEKQRTLSRKK